MKKADFEMPGLYMVTPQVFTDERGFFLESYNKRVFENLGISSDFVQDNVAMSEEKGTLRGLHTQKNPDAQSKLVECRRGSVFDVVVDVREGSPTYMKWKSFVLSEKEKQFLFVPVGCLHGYITLEKNCVVSYKVDQYYAPQSEQSVRYDDPIFAINWPVSKPILSEKDRLAPCFNESEIQYLYKD